MTALPDELSRWIWEHRYRWSPRGRAGDTDLEGTWQRIARAVAAAESHDQARWAERYAALLADFRFIPGGRILANAGTSRSATLLNCFVMGPIEDSIPGIFRALEESALTLQAGGGIGLDFSTLRPRGTSATSAGTLASGPVSFMRVWNAMCSTLLASGSRRGAMLATLRCDHPDILEFIDAKRDPAALRFFNLSVAASDAFLAAVREDAAWPLVFPEVAATPLRTVRAREVWQRLLDASYATAEPGLLFVDTINAENNLQWRERLVASNPCGEAPLPAHGACDLGSINLTRFVVAPFEATARLDLDGIAETASLATRFLDDVLDVTRYPLPAQAETAHATRRIGIGITGLADALAMLGLRYDTAAARSVAVAAMRTVCGAAYEASIRLAAEKGPFPAYDAAAFGRSRFVARLPAELRERIAVSGMRNSHLTAIAPAGTISLLAGNVSSGAEPIFSVAGRRRVLDADGRTLEFEVEDAAARAWKRARPGEPLPDAFASAVEIAPEDHLRMQGALQAWVDGAIAKTVNLPADFPRARYESLFQLAHALGLKGCTTYRPGTARGQVVSLGRHAAGEDTSPVEHCCAFA